MHTLALPITQSLGTTFRGADLDAYMSYVSRKVASQVRLPVGWPRFALGSAAGGMCWLACAVGTASDGMRAAFVRFASMHSRLFTLPAPPCHPQVPGHALGACKEAINKAAADALVAYRTHCAAASSSGQLILPEALKLLPVGCGAGLSCMVGVQWGLEVLSGLHK